MKKTIILATIAIVCQSNTILSADYSKDEIKKMARQQFLSISEAKKNGISENDAVNAFEKTTLDRAQELGKHFSSYQKEFVDMMAKYDGLCVAQVIKTAKKEFGQAAAEGIWVRILNQKRQEYPQEDEFQIFSQKLNRELHTKKITKPKSFYPNPGLFRNAVRNTVRNTFFLPKAALCCDSTLNNL